MRLEVLLRVVLLSATLHVVGALQVGHGDGGVHIRWELNVRLVWRVLCLCIRVDLGDQVIKRTLLELDDAVDVR